MIQSVCAGAKGFASLVTLQVMLLLVVVQGPTLRTISLDGRSGVFISDAGPSRLRPALLQICKPCWLHSACEASGYLARAFQQWVPGCWQV